MPEPTPEAWAQIRHAYEHTDRPIVDICAEHGITDPMLRYRVKRWGWHKRRSLIPREGPPALHAPLEGEGRRFERERKPTGWGEAEALASHPTPPAFAGAAAVDPPPQEPAPGRAQARPGWEGKEVHTGKGDEAAAIVPRLQSAVARLLPAIEATIARLASGPQHPREMEQAGRSLGALTRTLRELNGLLAEHNARPAANRYDDDMPEDLDAFRLNLARRIHAFVESRTRANGEDRDGEADGAPA